MVFMDRTIPIMQQLGCISLLKRIFRYSSVLQAIIIVFNMDFRYHEILKFAQSYTIYRKYRNVTKFQV